MPEYAILILPSANRVYTSSAPALVSAELSAFASVLSAEVRDTGTRAFGGVDYVTLTTDEPLSDDDIALVSNVSSTYALFEITGELLRPLHLTPAARFDSDLLTIQKYPGKTNEQFTQLVFNLTLLASRWADEGYHTPLHVLDPLCGRGTTLNQAMMYGHDATGVEVSAKDFEAYERFIKTWLRSKRLKHTAQSGVLRRHKTRLGQRLEIEYAADKDDYRAGRTRSLVYYNTDTLRTDELVREGSVHLVVTDAPYGVQHGSRAEDDSLARSPRDLLAAAIPGWTRVLRTGGAMGISFNTHVLNRAELIATCERAGLTVVTGPGYDDLAHRVDQSIERDVVVARK
ncbi:TRM11 family SAM-dependent methyltransferase [Saccharomonospora azurea]|uniref:N6-adenine-specific DNA methylase n=1 Tax=Saccharomonospora azurea NA-128 TaxID=882081 RepID=H8G626_9PSEU|nr:N6-adenine-specific DNA methylase [Saccharomonospora azurea]EHY91303.1 putative N6-adenine-specific DNA methylase [Saccharomonospora azurea NA-128]